MTQEALKLALDWAEAHGEIVFAGGGMSAVNKMNSWVAAIKEALAQRTEQNFCSRCGKRVGGIDSIHTCTPPMEMNT
jgi:hypothetical protein